MRNFFKILGGEDRIDLLSRDELVTRLSQHSRDKHYVYVIWRNDKPAPEPMYVGKGKGRRALHHFHKSDRRNPVKKRIFEKMLQRGTEPTFSLIGTEMTDEEAMTLEARTIRNLGRIATQNGPLANLTEGGEGKASTRVRGERHGHARAVFADGVRYEFLSDAAAALGVYPSAIHKRINNGWHGYFYVDVGQMQRRRPAKHSSEHIGKMRGSFSNRRKAVIVNDMTFTSLSSAAAFLGVSYATVRKRCSSGVRGYSYAA